MKHIMLVSVVFLALAGCGGGETDHIRNQADNTDNTKSKTDEIETISIDCSSISVPDTGQTQSFTSISGEDSDYHINPPNFSSNSSGVVTDNITGLAWTQTASPGPSSWANANSYCQNLNHAGFDDWRLPTIHELVNISNYGNLYPAIDTSIFLGTSSSPSVGLWSSDTDITDPEKAWSLIYSAGWVSTRAKAGEDNDILCARGDSKQAYFEDIGNIAVRDRITGLVWKKDNNILYESWEGAIQYCENLTHGGRDDWRLPNIKELFSIVDISTYASSINRVYFTDAVDNYYWSSTHQLHGATNAWPVNFRKGRVLNYSQNSQAAVRCVTCGM